MYEPILSVIVPVYNVSAFLPVCLESLLDQTLYGLEILCVDDASQDNSPQIVLEYQKKDSRIKLLTQPHMGVSAARNLGIDHATGKYIAFVDADDWAEPDMFNRMVTVAEENACDMVICSARVHTEHPEECDPDSLSELQASLTIPKMQMYDGNCSWDLLKAPGGWPFIWNKVIRRSCIQNHNIRFSSELALGEDGVFIHLLTQYLSRCVAIPEPLYNYRYMRKDSATKNLFHVEQIRFQHHIGVVRIMLQENKDRGILHKNGSELLRWIIQFLYFGFICLPADIRKVCAPEIAETFCQFHLAEYAGGLNIFEKRRMKKLQSVNHADFWRKWEILQTIAEDKLMEHFKLE